MFYMTKCALDKQGAITKITQSNDERGHCLPFISAKVTKASTKIRGRGQCPERQTP